MAGVASRQRQRVQDISIADAAETESLRRRAAQGDDKALAKYRNIMAAKVGKAPDDTVNEKLLDAYIRSTGEFTKDPNNMGKAAPTFQEFLSALPPGMFPNIQRYVGSPASLPPGAVKQVGTSGGRPVYQMRDGSQKVATQ